MVCMSASGVFCLWWLQRLLRPVAQWPPPEHTAPAWCKTAAELVCVAARLPGNMLTMVKHYHLYLFASIVLWWHGARACDVCKMLCCSFTVLPTPENLLDAVCTFTVLPIPENLLDAVQCAAHVFAASFPSQHSLIPSYLLFHLHSSLPPSSTFFFSLPSALHDTPCTPQALGTPPGSAVRPSPQTQAAAQRERFLGTLRTWKRGWHTAAGTQ